MKRILWIVVGLLALDGCAVNAGAKSEDVTFYDTLGQLSHEQCVMLTPGAARSAMTGASVSGGPRSFEAATRLWRNSRRLELEIAWLRQKDANARKYILALFYTQVDDPDTSIFPPFRVYIEKMNTDEARQRQAELEWVLKEKASLKPKIDALLVDSGKDFSRDSLEESSPK